MTSTTQRTAQDAYTEDRATAIALAERILETLRAQQAPFANWGDAGSMAYYRSRLQDVSDSLHNEGEYAFVGCTQCSWTGPSDDYAIHLNRHWSR
jgi:hypothetical protein